MYSAGRCKRGLKRPNAPSFLYAKFLLCSFVNDVRPKILKKQMSSKGGRLPCGLREGETERSGGAIE